MKLDRLLLNPNCPGLGSREAERELLLDAVLEFARTTKFELFERTGNFVGEAKTSLLSSSCAECSESLLGVPIIGDSVVGFEILLPDLDGFEAPEAVVPRSIIDELLVSF